MSALILDNCAAVSAVLQHVTYADAWKHLNPNLVAIGRLPGSGVPTVNEVMYLLSCWQKAIELNVYGGAADQKEVARLLDDAYAELAKLEVSRETPLYWPQPDDVYWPQPDDVVAEA